MPFTFVHPVVTIPYRKYGLPLSALIIGSMTPDINYFIFSDFKIGHTILGQFSFCLPIGFLCFIAFHLIIKKPALDLVPESQSRVLVQLKDINLYSIKLYPKIFIGILIGSFTHIIWDSFTHSYGFAVNEFAFLQIVLINTTSGSLRLYKVLQHGSTLIGIILLGYFYYKWYNSVIPNKEFKSGLSTNIKSIFLTLSFLAALSISILKGFQVVSNIVYFNSFRMFLGTAIKTFIPVISLMFFLYSIIWQIYFICGRADNYEG